MQTQHLTFLTHIYIGLVNPNMLNDTDMEIRTINVLLTDLTFS